MVKTIWKIAHVVEDMPKTLEEANGIISRQTTAQAQIAKKVLDEDELLMAILGVRIPLLTGQQLMADIGQPLLQNGMLPLEQDLQYFFKWVEYAVVALSLKYTWSTYKRPT